MARFGTWAPLASNWASQPKMTQVDIISLHTMVGTLAGTDAMFRRNGFGGTFSHFGIGGNGECTQWQDTAYKAAANYNGNWHIISVECADMGAPFPAWNTSDGNAVPAFTDAQVATLAELIRTIAPAHNIPIVLIPDAKPGRRGIGYHRQGVPGYMVPGAEQWSTAQGKVCPGNRRIAQIPQILQLAQGDDDMSYTQWPKADRDFFLNDIRDSVLIPWFKGYGDRIERVDEGSHGGWGYGRRIENIETIVAALQSALPTGTSAAQPAVSVDAAKVAATLAADKGFLDALAEALATKLGTRLSNG